MPHYKRALTQAGSKFLERVRELPNRQAILQREYDRLRDKLIAETPGNPAVSGYKVYSQFDEDGIIAEIFSRIGEGGRTFIEIGCSDGLENNTHTLLLKGWHGAWIDADASKVDFVKRQIPDSYSLLVTREFVSPENVSSMVSRTLEHFKTDDLDFLSIDIDGDDLNVLRTLVTKIRPRVICAEYNAKFPPPMRIAARPAANAAWGGDDYQGASLCCFVEMLDDFGYKLVACGLSGVNAFFINKDDADKFADYTAQQLFQPARYHFRRFASGHPPTLKFLADALSVEKKDALE
ncbi:MAG TPA: FkbM family methyltransferase [Gammaproteobacteria bacterium]|nr:FkbM family methyltransferase [Gammaproteobacteria bacterium]